MLHEFTVQTGKYREFLVGPSVTIPYQRSALVRGQWQAVYLAEFDGPRPRTLHAQLSPQAEDGPRGVSS